MIRLIYAVFAFVPVLVGCVPSNAVMVFDQTKCPAGWSEYASANGRAIVGLQPGGTLGSTVGSPLSNLENRAHTHAMGAASVATSQEGDHTHIWAKFFEGIYEWRTFDYTGDEYLLYDWNNGINGDGSGIYPLARKVPTNLPTSLYTDKRGVHAHNIDLSASASGTASTGETMPYIQLLVCKKD